MRICSGAQEIGRGDQIHATGGNKGNVGEWPAKGLDVAWPAHLGAGKNLDEIGSGGDRRHDLGWRQGSWQDHLVRRASRFNHASIKSGTHKKLCASINAAKGSIGVSDRTRPDEEIGGVLACELADGIDSSRNRHGDFHDRNSTSANSIRGGTSEPGRRRSYHRYDANLCNACSYGAMSHACNQRAMRAPTPFMT